ncbi:MAG: LuxR family transcriptional regulator [Pseudomonadota bacterium]
MATGAFPQFGGAGASVFDGPSMLHVMLLDGAASVDTSLREYARICDQITQTAELQKESIRFLKSRGCRFMSYHHIPPIGADAPDRETLIYVHGFPKPWVERYIGQQLYKVDPIPRRSQASTRPFRWLDLVGAPELTARERHYMEVLVDAGLGNGLAVPVFGPHGRNGYCGLGYGPDAGVAHDEEVTVLHEACHLSHLKYCELNPLPALNAKLSFREGETLSWVAKGLSNGQIADKMGVSPSTIDTNLRRIFAKLGVRDRVTAALRGVALGLFD